MAGFGTLSPGEEAEQPRNILDKLVSGAISTMASLPRRAIEGAAMYQPGSGEIPNETIAPALETAMMTMGGTSLSGPREAALAEQSVRPHIFERAAPIDAALPPEAQSAISRFVGGPSNARDIGHWGGIMNEHQLESAYGGGKAYMPPDPNGPLIRQQLEEQFQPVREQLRREHGNHITLYRHQRPLEGNETPRSVLSMTTDPAYAEKMAGVKPAAPLYTEAEMAAAQRRLEETGSVQIGRHTLTKNEYGNYDINDPSVGGYVTDTDGAREHMMDENRWRAENLARNDQRRATVQKFNVPIDDVVWATDRFGQKEFMVRTKGGQLRNYSEGRPMVLGAGPVRSRAEAPMEMVDRSGGAAAPYHDLLDAPPAPAFDVNAGRTAYDAIMRRDQEFKVPPLKRGYNMGRENPPDPLLQTVADPFRNHFPGIYGNPRQIAEEAASRVIPEDPALRRLWGVDRADLGEISAGRVGNEEPNLRLAKNPRGSLAAQNIQTPQNTQRLVDILGEAGKHEGLAHADAWYVMDPVYKRMEEMFGPEEAQRRFKHLNTMTGMASPGSDVMSEIQRGTGAHWLEQQGRFEDFQKFGGVPEEFRNRQAFPQDMRYIVGHPYHRTSQGEPMAKYLEHGSIQSDAPKVPLYVHASGVPETGFQTAGPVGDAHFSRGVGLSDTRKGPSDVQGSFSTSEYQTLQPWWQHDVAGKVGIESVPAQARLWTALGPQTGVESPLGQGKLELLSTQIMKAARRLRVSPETARDMILSGKAGAGVVAAGAMSPGVFGALGGGEQRQ